MRNPDVGLEITVVKILRSIGHEVETQAVLGERRLLLGVRGVDLEAHRFGPSGALR